MSPEHRSNQDPTTLVQKFDDSIRAVVESNGSRPFDGRIEQDGGRTGASFNIGGYQISFIDYEDDPSGYGKQSLWMGFKPNFGIRVETSNGKFTFASDQDDPTKMRRHFKYGGLIGSMSVSQIPDLFIGEIDLDDSQVAALLGFAEAPHKRLDSLRSLLILTDDEETRWKSSKAETAEKARRLRKDLESLSRARKMPGTIG